MITKRTEFGMITILPDGQIQLREDSIYEDEGVEVARKYHRRVLEPSEASSETDPRIQTAIGAFWTPEVIEEFKRKKAERERRTLAEMISPVVTPSVTSEVTKDAGE